MQLIRPRQRGFWLTLGAIAIFLLMLRIALPYGICWYLNRYVLEDLGDYSGHIEDIDISLISGAYSVNRLAIHKVSGEQPVPFLSLTQGDIALSWRALVSGEISIDLVLIEPNINFLDAQKENDRQSGEGGDWRELVDSIIPFSLKTIIVHDGAMTFQNRQSTPQVRLVVDELSAVVNNLTNIKDFSGERVASLEVSGRLLNHARFNANAKFDPFDYNDFFLAAKTEGLDLKTLNDFGRVYGKLDFASGQGDVFVELKAADKKLTGYVKPFFENVEVQEWEQDIVEDGDNVFEFLWEGMVGLVQTIFTNSETNKLATQIDIAGDLSGAEVDTWSAVWGVVKNAFVKSFEARFNRITPVAEDE